MAIILETNRLYLREVVEEDDTRFFELDSDPEVHKYLGGKTIYSIDEARHTIAFLQRQYAENGIGRWAMIDKVTNDFIGWTGLKLVKETNNGHSNYYDFGYRLLRKYWNKGYASETAPVCLDYGFNKMGLRIIYAAAHVDNAASNKILRNNGFYKVNEFYYEKELCNWYELPTDNW